jgi:hypothetical protein
MCPMAGVKWTWREKRLAREENSTDSDDSHVGYDMERHNDEDHTRADTKALDVNMVFVIPAEF